jgi:hypothetical protein
MTNGMISISPSSTFLTYVLIFQLHLDMVYIYILQVIRYVRACSTYDQLLVRGSLFTNKLMSQGLQLSRLQAAFRKFYGRYNDLISPYNLSLGNMLSDMFHTNR